MSSLGEERVPRNHLYQLNVVDTDVWQFRGARNAKRALEVSVVSHT